MLFDCEYGKGDACGFLNDPSADASWLLNQGKTDSTRTGPDSDHADGEGTVSYRPELAF